MNGFLWALVVFITSYLIFHLKLSFFEVLCQSSQPASPWHQSFSAEAQIQAKPESG